MEGEIQAEAEDSQNIDETNIIYENIRIDTEVVKIMKRVNRALAVGDLKKARRIVSQHGLADINKPEVRLKLLSKYPKKIITEGYDLGAC
jgi:hypothetical protein